MFLRWKTIITTFTITVITHNIVIINHYVYCTDTGNLKSPSTTSSISNTPDPGGGNNGSELSENNSRKQSDNQESVIVSQALKQSLTKINLIGLGSDNKLKLINSDEYDLVSHKNLLFKFMFKPGVRCILFKYGDQEVWKHDQNKYQYYYPRLITLTLDQLNIEIKDIALCYKYINDNWKLSDETTQPGFFYGHFTVITLDDESSTDSTTSSVVESKESSIKCKVNDTSKYDLIKYPNGSFMFIFNDGARCIGFKHDKLTVWKHDFNKHQTKYPNSIYCKADGSVYVYFDPYYYVYKLDTESNQWTLNSKLSYKPKGLNNPSEHPKCFTIVTLDVDGTSAKENDCSQYDLYNNFDLMYLYQFKAGARCTEFKFKGKTIWKHDDDTQKHKDKYPLSISIDLVDFTFDFAFGKDTLRYRLSDSGMICYTFSNDLTSYPPDSKSLLETTSTPSTALTQSSESGTPTSQPKKPKDSLDQQQQDSITESTTRVLKSTVDVKDTKLVRPTTKTTVLSQPKKPKEDSTKVEEKVDAKKPEDSVTSKPTPTVKSTKVSGVRGAHLVTVESKPASDSSTKQPSKDKVAKTPDSSVPDTDVPSDKDKEAKQSSSTTDTKEDSIQLSKSIATSDSISTVVPKTLDGSSYTSFKDIIKSEFQVDVNDNDITVDHGKARITITISREGDDVGAQGTAKTQVDNKELLFKVKVKEGNNQSIADTLAGVDHDLLKTFINNLQSRSQPTKSTLVVTEQQDSTKHKVTKPVEVTSVEDSKPTSQPTNVKKEQEPKDTGAKLVAVTSEPSPSSTTRPVESATLLQTSPISGFVNAPIRPVSSGELEVSSTEESTKESEDSSKSELSKASKPTLQSCSTTPSEATPSIPRKTAVTSPSTDVVPSDKGTEDSSNQNQNSTFVYGSQSHTSNLFSTHSSLDTSLSVPKSSTFGSLSSNGPTISTNPPITPLKFVVDPDHLKITTLESDNTTTKENDATKYTLKQYDKIFKLEFKDDAKCTKVILDNDTLYEYKEDESDGQYPKEIYFNTETDCVYILFFKTSLIPFYGDEWKPESGASIKFSGSLFKIIIDGSSNPNDTDKFDETQEGSFVKCKFKDNVKCTELKYDDQQVWKYEQGTHPKSLYFHKLIKVVFVEFDNVYMLSRYDLDNCSWKSEKLEKGSFDSSKLHVQTPDSDGCTTEDDSSVTDKINLGPIVYYTVKYDANYFNFKYDKEIIIRFTDDNNQFKFKGIFFLSDPGKFLVHFEDQSLYVNNLDVYSSSDHQQDSSKQSQPTKASKPTAKTSQSSNPTTTNNDNTKRTGVVLDINSKKSTDQYTYNVNNKIHTYEAIGNYAFNKVKQKSGGLFGVGASDKELWSTTDSTNYAKKVIFDDGNNTVTITLLNDISKKFNKTGSLNKTWSEVTISRSPTSESQQTSTTDGSQGSVTPLST